MTNFKGFASLVLAAATVSTLSAETRCPGNVASVPFQIVNRRQIILAVSVNHSVPFRFLLDTGAQKTIIDASLAAELHLQTQDNATVAGVGYRGSASLAQVDQLQAGSHVVANQLVLIYDLQNVISEDLPIRGILGEDFLEQFDMLIDNAHSVLCLDDSAAMSAKVKGTHVALVTLAQPTNNTSVPSPLVVAARISDGKRPLRLELDSGANLSILYDVRDYMDLGLLSLAASRGKRVDGAEKSYSTLPLQEVKIGSLDLPEVTFVTRRGSERNPHMAELDGLLMMGLFRRVFVDHTNHFAVLEPW
jgi:hypothetical protein